MSMSCASSDPTKMNEELWNRVDDFLSEVLGTSDRVLEESLRASAKAGLPAIRSLGPCWARASICSAPTPP